MANVLPRDVRERSRERAADFGQLVSTLPPDRVELGQIWSTRAVFELPDGRRYETDEPRLVVVLDGDLEQLGGLGQIPVAPISPEVEYATDFDFIVPPSSGPVGFTFMAEVWNETPALVGHLRQFLGTVSGSAASALLQLYNCHLLDESIPSEIRGWVGAPIFSDDDERLAFQETEIQSVAYLALAAAAVLSSAERRESLRVDAAKEYRWRWVLEAKPRLGWLSDLNLKRDTALAAGRDNEGQTYIIDLADSDRFVRGELLCHRRHPYTIYISVYSVSPSLSGHMCMVALRSATKTWESAPDKLRVNAKIEIGEDPEFRPGDVLAVRLQIE
jgi:hypothetical protein